MYTCTYYTLFLFKDSHFIRCIKPNNNGIIGLFDYDFIASQLKACSIVPYINLMRKGYPTRITYADFCPNFDTYLPNEVTENQQKLAELLLLSIGFETIDYKLGNTQVFFRPGKSSLFYQLDMSNEFILKDLASKIENRIKIEKQQTLCQKESTKVEQPVPSLDIPNCNY